LHTLTSMQWLGRSMTPRPGRLPVHPAPHPSTHTRTNTLPTTPLCVTFTSRLTPANLSANSPLPPHPTRHYHTYVRDTSSPLNTLPQTSTPPTPPRTGGVGAVGGNVGEEGAGLQVAGGAAHGDHNGRPIAPRGPGDRQEGGSRGAAHGGGGRLSGGGGAR